MDVGDTEGGRLYSHPSKSVNVLSFTSNTIKKILIKIISLADLKGCAPPSGSIFLSFSCCFQDNFGQIINWHPTLGPGAPTPVWEILDPPLNFIHMIKRIPLSAPITFCIVLIVAILHQVRSYGRSISSTVLWAPTPTVDFSGR